MATTTLKVCSPVATLASSQCSTSAPSSALVVSAGRSHFWGSNLELLPASSDFQDRSERKAWGVRAEGFDLWQVLGGRGLQGGEQGLKDEKTEKVLKDAASAVKAGKSNGAAGGATGAAGEVEEVGSFDKELLGLTGGFPGGEKGVKKFVTKNPPPQKLSSEVQQLQVGSNLGRVLTPPLLLPGMTVRVVESKNPYHMFTGIVQRVTDGKAGVIFEGGNWDKLVTFKITDLERTAKGPQ